MLEKSKLKKNAIAASLQSEIAREIEELFGSQALEEIDFEALETAMRRRALQLAARLLEQRFNRDPCDYQGSSFPCACGRRARYVERWKSFHSVVGELKLERAYYYCWECAVQRRMMNDRVAAAGTSVRRRPCHRPHPIEHNVSRHAEPRESVDCGIREVSDSERQAGQE